ncbi:hypothetical protein BOSE62_130822 [Bosea sp. 62]|nr:hypothetical protein BOSE7B_120852 [Bosea sp. 7B]CAD5273466.1 hypothetical protein BOSE21B_30061 [Bosea sp. 21B]CAD5284629.1 hypothetical protein BOSE46_50187 [Bosea sp. 46]VVT60201.1 hypothetical protein BOS5A_210992 [Bosea sp. EC-HK365B]VXB58954.1 hypothetical protein BOSE62_130822 [Bosea sp. 62]VXC11458.1 hypothetical protein BOSE29B_30059 [Bosea sp. 29B]VXC21207.1 hypothetical protein BOSE127_170490 [Bosea sp. 127]VXC63964.1 hypothetical protein BOSE125_30440 [Bosea sp. 125]
MNDLLPILGSMVRIHSPNPSNHKTWEARKRRIFRRFLLFELEHFESLAERPRKPVVTSRLQVRSGAA